MDDREIATLVASLSRPHPSGGTVVERAAILAAGADYPAILNWIIAHSGTPEATTARGRSQGLHGSRIRDGRDPGIQQPTRFVLPADAHR